MLQTSMHFLARNDLYREEKPFSLRFEPEREFPNSNITMEKHEDITVEDIRGREQDFSIEQNGFTIMPFDSHMAYDDFDDERKVIDVYLKEVADRIRIFLGSTYVQIFEHTVRKRHETFPISTGKPYRYNQPTSMAHIDATPEYVAEMVKKLNGDKAGDLLRHRVQCVNIWKPLKGPVRDWPLALCDASSVNPEQDLEPADLVYADYVIENCQVYRTLAQKWYYLRDQTPSEALVFRQTDSDSAVGAGVPHSSFPNPLASKDEPPRESIEVRALVYYADDQNESNDTYDRIFGFTGRKNGR